jgi:hypothetical protein
LKFIENLVGLGVKTVRDYEESHSGFFSPWGFVVAFKESSTISEWFCNSAEIDLKIRKRSMDAVLGESLFHHFDGATMESFRFPSKGSEVSFCRNHPSSRDCVEGYGLDAQRFPLPLTSSEHETINRQYSGLVAREFANTDDDLTSCIGRKEVPTVAMGFRTVALILCIAKVIPSFWMDLFHTSADGKECLNSFQVSVRYLFWRK